MKNSGGIKVKKQLLLLLFLIIPIANAQLIFNQSSLDISAMIGQPKTFQLDIKNPYNYTIFDIQFSSISGLSFSNISSINPNQTATVTITASPTSTADQTVESTVFFKYLINISQEPQDHSVNITGTGFIPSKISIYEGDSITWTNIDSINHILSSSAFGQDIELYPNQSYQRTFAIANFINYQDNVLFFGATINVTNKTLSDYAHDSSTDSSFPFRLRYSLVPTVIEFNVTEGKNMTVAYGNTNEGLIKVRNTGALTALNITFTSSKNWITFDENIFNLAPDETNFLTFKVSPIIYTTSESNTTNTITITMAGVNTPTLTDSITVFVPYVDLTKLNESEIGSFFKDKLIFCSKYNTSPFCISEPITRTEEKIVVKMQDLPYNFTQTDVMTIFKRLQSVEDQTGREYNLMKLQDDKLREILPIIASLQNDSINMQKKNEERIQTNERVAWILGGTIVIIICITTVIVLYGRYKNEREKNKVNFP
jgi:plastocyanin